MLNTFNEETDLGKLYINYPMVESLRDQYAFEEEKCYRRCMLDIDDIKKYKKTVHEIKKYQDFRHLSKNDWYDLCRNSLRKLNCIIKGRYELPERNDLFNELTQDRLYDFQKTKFIKNGKIGIINSFPLFIYEYFRESIWEA